MNYQQRRKRGKKRRGIRSRGGFLRRMKKVRGKCNRRDRYVKIMSVTDTHFILSTSFATYRIPRFHFRIFKNATQHDLQNVVGFITHTFQYDSNGSHILSFYWYNLDEVFEAPDFDRFRITE